MNHNGYMVFWWQLFGGAKSLHFEMNNMKGALDFMKELRADPSYEYITMVSKNPDMVGKSGVNDVLPEDYSWSMEHRIGAAGRHG